MSFARYRHAPLGTAIKLLRGRVARPPAPLAVYLQLTHRCTLRCRYCRIWDDPPPELDTAALRTLIDQIADAGVERLSLSGGEPTLRDDLGELVGHAKTRGLTVNLLSNGAHLVEHLPALRALDFLAVSLDGPAPIHDALRGRGSHARAVAAIDAARAAGIEVWTTTVLTRSTLPHLDALLAFGRDRRIRVSFQPVMAESLGACNAEALAPATADLRAACDALLRESHRAGTPLAMSRPLLRFYRDHWGTPAPTRPGTFHAGRLRCHAGRQFATISPDGRLFPCTPLAAGDAGIEVRAEGFAAAWARLPAAHCGGCWCDSLIESNFAFNLHPATLRHLYRLLANPSPS